jgi:response regulator of citrate/malate metabolism
MRLNQQKRLENIRRTLELSGSKSVDEIAELLRVTPNTIRNYLTYAQSYDLTNNTVTEVVCADCGRKGSSLHKYLCLNPPFAYDVIQFLGRHTSIHSL